MRFILGDDIGCERHEIHDTTNFDQLAATGIRFTGLPRRDLATILNRPGPPSSQYFRTSCQK